MKVTKNPTRALQLDVDLSNAAATRNPKAIAATAFSVIESLHQGKGLYFGKIHYNLLEKKSKKEWRKLFKKLRKSKETKERLIKKKIKKLNKQYFHHDME